MGLTVLKAASHTRDDGSSYAEGYEVFRKNVADAKEACQLWLGKAPTKISLALPLLRGTGLRTPSARRRITRRRWRKKLQEMK
eukprot:11930753-Alexandrium_andersonii.AAC.1